MYQELFNNLSEANRFRHP